MRWLFLLLLAGCADTHPLVSQHDSVVLRVTVGTAGCPKGAAGCASKTVMIDGVANARIRIPRPQSWHDWPAMCIAGHELWEVLSPERHGHDVKLILP